MLPEKKGICKMKDTVTNFSRAVELVMDIFSGTFAAGKAS